MMNKKMEKERREERNEPDSSRAGDMPERKKRKMRESTVEEERPREIVI